MISLKNRFIPIIVCFLVCVVIVFVACMEEENVIINDHDENINNHTSSATASPKRPILFTDTTITITRTNESYHDVGNLIFTTELAAGLEGRHTQYRRDNPIAHLDRFSERHSDSAKTGYDPPNDAQTNSNRLSR